MTSQTEISIEIDAQEHSTGEIYWNYFIIRDDSIDCLDYGIGFGSRDEAERYARMCLYEMLDREDDSA